MRLQLVLVIQLDGESNSFFFWKFKEKMGTQNGRRLHQRTLTYFVRGSITVWLTSYLTGLDLTKPENMFLIQHQQSI